MKASTVILIILLGLVVITVTACAPGGGTYNQENHAGFFPAYGMAGLHQFH